MRSNPFGCLNWFIEFRLRDLGYRCVDLWPAGFLIRGGYP